MLSHYFLPIESSIVDDGYKTSNEDGKRQQRMQKARANCLSMSEHGKMAHGIAHYNFTPFIGPLKRRRENLCPDINFNKLPPLLSTRQ